MKKMNIMHRPTDATDTTFEDFYAELSSDWQDKATRLQARRWRAVMRGND